MRGATITLIALFILMGCTVIRMQEENRESEARIAQKEAQLNELEAESVRLDQHRALLVEKFDQTKMTSQQLNNELNQLIRQNRQLATMAKEQGQDSEKTKQEIAALEARQASLARLAESGVSEAAKEKKILELQQEIRNYLLLGLKSKHRKSLQ